MSTLDIFEKNCFYCYFLNAILYYFVYLIGLNLHLLHIQTYRCKAITLKIPLILHIKYSHYKIFLMKVADLNEICILCCTNFVYMNEPFFIKSIKLGISFTESISCIVSIQIISNSPDNFEGRLIIPNFI